MKEINRNISRNIRHYMDTLNVTQIELSKLLNCSNTTVSMWIQGNSTPRMDKIDKMCEIFGCSRQDLIADTVKEPEDILHDQLVSSFVNDFVELSPEQKLRVIAYMRQLMKGKEDEVQ